MAGPKSRASQNPGASDASQAEPLKLKRKPSAPGRRAVNRRHLEALGGFSQGQESCAVDFRAEGKAVTRVCFSAPPEAAQRSDDSRGSSFGLR
jgi:hypothetical protein